jgi:hypothetical protein
MLRSILILSKQRPSTGSSSSTPASASAAWTWAPTSCWSRSRTPRSRYTRNRWRGPLRCTRTQASPRRTKVAINVV